MQVCQQLLIAIVLLAAVMQLVACAHNLKEEYHFSAILDVLLLASFASCRLGNYQSVKLSN